MPLYLVAPGERIKIVGGKPYPNRFYLVRGEVGGRNYEVSSKTADETAARIFKNDLETRLLSGRVPGPGEAITFPQATEFYIASIDATEGDARRIRRVAAAIGDKLVAEVQHADLVAAAELVMPGRKPETKNRWVVKPGAAVLHYAAENKWRDWLRIRKLKEGPIVTRASDSATAQALLAALATERDAAKTEKKRRVAGRKLLLILWIFKHGNRISDPLRLTWEASIDLPGKRYTMLVGKGNRYREKPLDDEVFELLANEPDQRGRLFPWKTRSGVYKWLRPLVRRLKLTFTPHMARHYLGKHLNATGAGGKTVMAALDQADPQSAVRYQDADAEIVRTAIKRTPRLGGPKMKRRSRYVV
jgi:site-specific recombinase XerD